MLVALNVMCFQGFCCVVIVSFFADAVLVGNMNGTIFNLMLTA